MSYNLRDFGSYTAGGRIAQVTEGAPQKVNFTRSASFEVDPRGHFAIEHAYVQYFIPEARNDGHPVVLVHGGGMSGSCWETTPDGRPGWLHEFLRLGYEVHVVDAVERGRAGFAPDQWEGTPLLRSLEEAWSLFRIGPREGFATRTSYPGQRFPVAHFEAFARSFVPRWTTTTPLQVEALLAVLERTGPAIVVCHSQGGEIAFDALARAPSSFGKLIAVEPSCTPKNENELHGKSVCLIVGDYLDQDAFWEDRAKIWAELSNLRNVSLLGPNELGQGHSHILMSDRCSSRMVQTALDALPA